VIRFTIKIHPDGFVGVNFSFEASDHKLNAFGNIPCSIAATQRGFSTLRPVGQGKLCQSALL
jgi:hypothetical protein